MLKIVAIDPGETSAFVVAELRQCPNSSATLPSPSTSNQVVAAVTPPALRMLAKGTWKGMSDLQSVATYLFPASTPSTPEDPGAGLTNLTRIVIEDYRVYPHKLKEHIGSPVYTAREIGRIEWLAHVSGLPITYQSASMAKSQWPNSRLSSYVPRFFQETRGQDHIRDAMRHLLTYLEHEHLMEFFQSTPI